MKYTCTKCGERYEDKISALMCHPNIAEPSIETCVLNEYLNAVYIGLPGMKFTVRWPDPLLDDKRVLEVTKETDKYWMTIALDISIELLMAHHEAETLYHAAKSAVTEIRHEMDKRLKDYITE